MKALLFLCCLGLVSAGAFGQTPTSAKARLSTGLARLGEIAHVRLTVENAEQVRVVALPAVEGLRVGRLSAPMRSSFSEFRGGRMIKSTSVQWTLSLEPEQAGEYEIPPFRVEVDGEELEVPVTPSTLKVVKDLEADKLGLFEIPGRPTRVYEGQPFSLRLRLGWAERLQVKKISLLLPWWGTQSGVLDVEGPGFSSRAQNVLRLLVNGNYETPFAALDPVEVEGETFRLFEHVATMVATRAGTLEYPTSTFVFAEEVERSTSPFRASRLREYYATLEPFTIEVLPIPEADRPFEWGGAVGTLTAERRVNQRDVAAGETIQLEVTWSGMANTEFFDLPDLKRIEAFENFRVLGVEDTHLGMERRAVYELVPLTSEVTEIPPVPLWVFNTDTESYEEILTAPLPIRVREAEALDLTGAFGENGPEAPKRDLRDLRRVGAVASAAHERGPASVWLFGGTAFVVVGWWFLRTWVRRSGDPASIRVRARRGALRRLERELAEAQSPTERTQALAAFLGVRSDETAEAWIGRDVIEWAKERSASLDSDGLAQAQQLQTVLTELDEAAYAGHGEGPDRAQILSAARGMLQGGAL